MAGHKNHFAFIDLKAEVFEGVKTARIGFANLFETDHEATDSCGRGRGNNPQPLAAGLPPQARGDYNGNSSRRPMPKPPPSAGGWHRPKRPGFFYAFPAEKSNELPKLPLPVLPSNGGGCRLKPYEISP
ncbi:MAG: hypothetical protein Q4A62_03740 [Eikenella sp.]|nr:hypothetical protein [Eikenella sp.]